jgi:hypothetical protein
MSLGSATLADGTYPATFVSDPLHASCNDWIVYGLAGKGKKNGQANLVAFTNLYVSGSGGNGQSGICEAPGTHTDPKIMFALNLTTVKSGVIKTSPVLSLVGDKVAVVESSAQGGTVFHVLTVAGNNSGTPTAAAAPAPGTLASVVLSTTADDSFASPWVDYGNDIGYVATNDGVLHKITGIFLGIPTEVKSGPWPLTVAANQKLTSPVLDFDSGKIFLAGGNGMLYSVACTPLAPADTTSCAVSSSVKVVAANSILDPPIVDSSSQRVYWFSNNDGLGANNPVLIQTDMDLVAQTTASLLVGSPTNNGIIRAGTFDNDWFNTGNGNLWVCGYSRNGSGGPRPALLRFSIQGGNLATTPNANVVVSSTNRDKCSAPTEVFNGTSELFFVGTGKSGIIGDTVCSSGCVQSFAMEGNNIVRQAVAAENGLPSGIVLDNTDVNSPQAASIYFAQQGGYKAVKLTQSGLQ